MRTIHLFSYSCYIDERLVVLWNWMIIAGNICPFILLFFLCRPLTLCIAFEVVVPLSLLLWPSACLRSSFPALNLFVWLTEFFSVCASSLRQSKQNFESRHSRRREWQDSNLCPFNLPRVLIVQFCISVLLSVSINYLSLPVLQFWILIILSVFNFLSFQSVNPNRIVVSPILPCPPADT